MRGLAADLSKFALEVESKHSFLEVGHGREEEHVEDGAQEAGCDGHELRGGERHLVHLHPREQQQGQGGGDHKGAALVECHDWFSLVLMILQRWCRDLIFQKLGVAAQNFPAVCISVDAVDESLASTKCVQYLRLFIG